ncbi:MAG: glycerophosphoryl diester phosphodiesterase membrane domain-containing protein [Buchananella hordeovulneris]|nr:glycerophosphoryl diester phosphodiesterase membrane domain-containing protein [Buchananella hordeovulneris]
MAEPNNGWTLGPTEGHVSSAPATPYSAPTAPTVPVGSPTPGPVQTTPQQAGAQAATSSTPNATPGGAPAQAPASGTPQYGQYASSVPQYGQYASPGPQGSYQALASGTPQYGQYGSAQSATSYGFAPRPGIIPLRPLTLADFLDGAFKAIRTNPAVMFGFSAVVMIGLGLLSAFATSSFQAAALSGNDLAMLDEFGDSIPGLIGTAITSVLGTSVLMGVLVLAVSRAVLGRVLTFGQIWEQVKGRILPLIGQSFIISVVTAVVSGGIIFVFAIMMAGAFTASSVAGGLLLIFVGIVLAAVAGALFYVRWSVAPAVLILEQSKIFKSLGRSWELTKGHFWRIFGVFFVTALITGVINALISGVFSIPVALIAATGSGPAEFSWAVIFFTTLISSASAAITVPFTASVMSLVYIDLRIRKEGLDVELAQAAAMEA